MNDILLWAGRLAGVIGIVTCALALFVRVSGSYTMAGFEVGTLFLGGTAAMVTGCFCLLLRMDDRG
ncbi:MAG TPA: hypothetical protein VJV77_08170 [Casimicrobiaceae bacterium]|nr:hypothetical protein [Casimicrobiaceae bacterium]